MKILDTTLRDGGYCNNWNWKLEAAQMIVNALYPHVDIIEIGFRTPSKTGP